MFTQLIAYIDFRIRDQLRLYRSIREEFIMSANKINPMLLIDFYKAVHAEMLPKGITKSVSYFTPRMSRVNRWDKVVMFGLQGFIKNYLIDYFNEEFFGRPFDEVIED